MIDNPLIEWRLQLQEQFRFFTRIPLIAGTDARQSPKIAAKVQNILESSPSESKKYFIASSFGFPL